MWGSTNLKRKMHMVSWKKITKTKPSGGLDIQISDIKNTTMYMSNTWKLTKNTNSF